MQSRQLKKEVEELKSILQSKQKRIDNVVTKLQKQKKKSKETQKYLETGDRQWATQVQILQEKVKDLRHNEDTLITDLVQQQKIAKDSLKAIQQISNKFDSQKRQLISLCQSKQNDIFERQRDNYIEKISTLQQLTSRLQAQLQRAEVVQSDLQVKNRLIQENDNSIANMKAQNSRIHQHNQELKQKARTLQNELQDAKASYMDQHKTYEAHLQLMKNQLNSADGQRQQYFEQNMNQLQQEIALKQEQIKLLRNELELSESNYKSKVQMETQRDRYYEKQIEDLRQQNDKLRKELESSNIAKKEANEFSKELQNIRSELQNQKQKFNEKISRTSNKRQQEKSEWNGIYQDMKNEISNLRGEIQTLSVENRALNRKFGSDMRSGGGNMITTTSGTMTSMSGNPSGIHRPQSSASSVNHLFQQQYQLPPRYGSQQNYNIDDVGTTPPHRQQLVSSPLPEHSPTRLLQIPGGFHTGRSNHTQQQQLIATGNFTPTPGMHPLTQSMGSGVQNKYQQQNMVHSSLQNPLAFNDMGTIGQYEGESNLSISNQNENDKIFQSQSESINNNNNNNNNNNGSMNEKLRQKEDEIKILWSVLKDFNRKKNEGEYSSISPDQVKQVVNEKINQQSFQK